MNLASRPTGNNTEINYNNSSNGSKLNFNVPFANQFVNQGINSSKNSSGVFINMFNNGFYVPRQITVQARSAVDNVTTPIQLSFISTIGQGTFGQIEKARLNVPNLSNSLEMEQKKSNDSNKLVLNVAVKRVLQDPRYKNRELSIMQRLNNHPNIVKFYYYYHSTASTTSRSHRSGNSRGGSSNSGFDVFLHLILECFPESLCDLIQRYVMKTAKIPTVLVQVFTYQMLQALAYLHSKQICHRDIKSSNLLVDESTAVLKVCDFGSAKEMIPGTPSVSYISSRYYRAPELLFGSQLYTCAIDTWSAGCVLAEMLRQHCLFTGSDSVDQLIKVVRVLGTPSMQDVQSMNSMYGSYRFPNVQSCPIKLFFPKHTSTELLCLLTKMLVYNPNLRIKPLEALDDSCFDSLMDLRSEGLLTFEKNGQTCTIRIPSSIFMNPISSNGKVLSSSSNGGQGLSVDGTSTKSSGKNEDDNVTIHASNESSFQSSAYTNNKPNGATSYSSASSSVNVGGLKNPDYKSYLDSNSAQNNNNNNNNSISNNSNNNNNNNNNGGSATDSSVKTQIKTSIIGADGVNVDRSSLDEVYQT